MTVLKKSLSVLSLILGLILAGLILFLFLTSTGSDAASPLDNVSASLMSKFEIFVNNSSSEALAGIVPIKKVYTLAEDLVVAPEPDQSLFGTTDNPSDLDELIASAEELLEGQSTLFNSSTPLMRGSKINYYLDETILAITWKQAINGSCYTFSEVKIADASQFRRYMADNRFGADIQYRPSDMAATVNAVVAMSGDFYKFRDMGIVVYQREVHRVRGKYLDTCFIDSDGDLNFVRRGEIDDISAAEAYVKENDILFSLAFGPVLVDNGVKAAPSSYAVGEIGGTYSRTAIAQLGDKHYLLVSVNFEDPYVGTSVKQLTSVLESLGCQKAYALDGGQTATVIMNDTVINRVDFGYQRNISDIIYFATALPDWEVSIHE